MGLFAFNRMRLKKIQEMSPENIAKETPKEKELIKEVKEEVVEQAEYTREQEEKNIAGPKEEIVKRGSSRKK